MRWFRTKSHLCRELEVQAIRDFLESEKGDTETERTKRLADDAAWMAAMTSATPPLSPSSSCSPSPSPPPSCSGADPEDAQVSLSRLVYLHALYFPRWWCSCTCGVRSVAKNIPIVYRPVCLPPPPPLSFSDAHTLERMRTRFLLSAVSGIFTCCTVSCEFSNSSVYARSGSFACI